MQYRQGMPVSPGGPSGQGGPSSGPNQPYAKGGGPMPMGGGGMGQPMPGGPQPMPKPPGGMGGGGPDQFQMTQNPAMANQQNMGRLQRGVDEAMMNLQRARLSGANPMQLAELEQAAMQAQRGMEQWQQQQYAQGMSDMNQRGPGDIGGGRGQTQMEQNPYLRMLLQSQLGMGGGGGSSMGGLGGIGRG